MFIPNNSCAVMEIVSRSMRGGVPEYGPAKVHPCAIVRLKPTAQKTSVRADSSASKGSSDEVVAEAVILFANTYNPPIGAVVTIAGYALQVTGSQPRFDLLGSLDHHEVTLSQHGKPV